MSRSTRLGLFSSGTLVLLVGLAVLSSFPPLASMAMPPSGPPEFVMANVDLDPPKAGATVEVTTHPDSFESGSVVVLTEMLPSE